MIVNRPARDRDFNGTVVVEWLNVTGGVDASPDWGLTHIELMRRGYAYVAVSAQKVGLDATKGADPARYAALSHPGDQYSYDIYAQAGQAVRSSAGVLLGGLRPQRVLAVGESQSAARLTTYIDAVHPRAHVYDGFLVHSRFGAAGSDLAPGIVPQAPTRIRDAGVPVLAFQTESDLGGLAARQPDSATYRLWEVAGTAHFDQYGLLLAATDTGNRQGVAAWFDAMRNPTATPSPQFACGRPINTGPQTYVLRAAVSALDTWVRTGRPPAGAPRFQLGGANPADPYARDANGIVLGGIRTPAVDAPVATLSGVGQTGNQFCFLFGTTTPFTPQQLTALYRNHGGFVSAWNQVTQSAVQAGYLVREDADLLRPVAAQSSVPR